jgi:hypothetical protein
MPLPTPADIALGTRRAQIETRELSLIKARYPTQARDGVLNPQDGLFDLAVDAQSFLDIQSALQGSARGRFAVEVQEVIWYDPVAYQGIRLIDADATPPIDVTCLVTRWLLDCEREVTTFELLG